MLSLEEVRNYLTSQDENGDIISESLEEGQYLPHYKGHDGRLHENKNRNLGESLRLGYMIFKIWNDYNETSWWKLPYYLDPIFGREIQWGWLNEVHPATEVIRLWLDDPAIKF